MQHSLHSLPGDLGSFITGLSIVASLGARGGRAGERGGGPGWRGREGGGCGPVVTSLVLHSSGSATCPGSCLPPSLHPHQVSLGVVAGDAPQRREARRSVCGATTAAAAATTAQTKNTLGLPPPSTHTPACRAPRRPWPHSFTLTPPTLHQLGYIHVQG